MKRKQLGDVRVDLRIDEIAEAAKRALDPGMFAAARVVKAESSANAQSLSQGITEGMYAISRSNVEGRPHKTAQKVVKTQGGAVVSSSDPKTHLFELGVEPHVIQPRRGKALRLDNGRWVKGRVQHPGMAARPFLRPALDSTKREATEAALKVIRTEMQK